MNVGYMNSNDREVEMKMECPLCKSNIYVSKYGTDYKCMNPDCILFENAGNVVKRIWSALDGYNK